MATTQGKFGRRFAEEFEREAAALASRPGASDTQAAHDLGVSPYSVGRGKKLYGPAPAAASAPGVSVQARERRLRVQERECAALRAQRTILKKAVALFCEPPR